VSFTDKFIKIVTEECLKRGLDSPSNSYFQCGQVCSAILRAAENLGLSDFEVMGALVKVPDDADYSDKRGQKIGHYYLRYGSTIYDFTLRQFKPDSPYPFVTEDNSREAKEIYNTVRVGKHNSPEKSAGHSYEQMTDEIVERFKSMR
jgi:hypothetical protein